VRTRIAAIVAAACILTGLAGCGTKPSAVGPPGAASEAAAVAPLIAGPGQVEPRSAVPWAKVGPGWVLVEGFITTPAKKGKKASDSEVLYLADPAGGKYTLFTSTGTATGAAAVLPGFLFAWSGDKQRALFGHLPSRSDPNGFGPTTELNLRTGRRTTIPVSQKDIVVGYTRPVGDQILVETPVSLLVSTVDVVSRAGKVTARLSRGFVAADPLPTPDGKAYVITADDGNHLVSATGKAIRHLNSGGAGCAPVRWWNDKTLLATCTMSPGSDTGDQQMWLIPESGGKPVALTPQRPVDSGPDQGDFNYVRLASGDYVDAIGATCGNHVVARLEPRGKVALIKVPGVTDSKIVAATTSRLLLFTQSSSCDGSAGISEGLIWLDPKTGAKTTVLPASKDNLLAAVVPYYDEGPR
jgi:hypothetical protein